MNQIKHCFCKIAFAAQFWKNSLLVKASKCVGLCGSSVVEYVVRGFRDQEHIGGVNLKVWVHDYRFVCLHLMRDKLDWGLLEAFGDCAKGVSFLAV